MAALQIIFDQDCGVCQASVAWLKRRDSKSQFEFIGNDSPNLPAGISQAEADETVFLIDPETHRVRSRADALGAVARRLPGFRNTIYRALGALVLVPGLRQIANALYRVFAKHRHQVSAALGMNACGVPPRKGAA